ncbi:hypothetical protein KGF54_000058 [Candida jiufengensis]|uniref:uncharacterized protein n=1 Tax=Candida jiufengensis TaxID=497108 RepID=UPI0022253323|nr:uncharacterized protein KGF54_000058 [Candida jiufengensis]KAI5957130.1 hypothetical protein KGF54_000058 [Candida jiufengensis]
MAATPRQLKLIDEAVNNHLKYYDTAFSDLLKHRVECLLLNTILSKDYNQNVEEEESQSKIPSSTRLRLHKFQVENSKLELSITNHIDQFLTILSIQNKMKPDIITDITNQLTNILNQNDHLKSKINRINTIEKPLMDKITGLIESFETNVNKMKVRLMHPSIIKNLDNPSRTEEQKANDLLQIDYRSFVLQLEDIKQEFKNFPNFDDELLNKEIEENLNNIKIFDKLDDDQIIYKLSRSTLPDISEELTIDNYEDLILKTIDDIKILNNENEKTKTSWNSNAEIIMKFKNIIDESKDDDNDIKMEE